MPPGIPGLAEVGAIRAAMHGGRERRIRGTFEQPALANIAACQSRASDRFQSDIGTKRAGRSGGDSPVRPYNARHVPKPRA